MGSSDTNDSSLKKRLGKIKMLACDFDGVFTDGKVMVSQDGNESVLCSRKDSMGILLLKKSGVDVVVISYEGNPVVTKRCEKMDIRCYQKVQSGEGKVDILKRVITEKRLSPEQVVFVGDDINDIPALKYVGVAMTVSDGHPSVKNLVDFITVARGGDHAIREIAQKILEAQGKPTDII